MSTPSTSTSSNARSSSSLPPAAKDPVYWKNTIYPILKQDCQKLLDGVKDQRHNFTYIMTAVSTLALSIITLSMQMSALWILHIGVGSLVVWMWTVSTYSKHYPNPYEKVLASLNIDGGKFVQKLNQNNVETADVLLAHHAAWLLDQQPKKP